VLNPSANSPSSSPDSTSSRRVRSPLALGDILDHIEQPVERAGNASGKQDGQNDADRRACNRQNQGPGHGALVASGRRIQGLVLGLLNGVGQGFIEDEPQADLGLVGRVFGFAQTVCFLANNVGEFLVVLNAVINAFGQFFQFGLALYDFSPFCNTLPDGFQGLNEDRPKFIRRFGNIPVGGCLQLMRIGEQVFVGRFFDEVPLGNGLCVPRGLGFFTFLEYDQLGC
jgi:hypothetical protein